MQRWNSQLRLETRFRRGLLACLALLGLLVFPTALKAAPGETGNSSVDWVLEATNHLGKWIWDTNTFDKQTIRLVKPFAVPAGEKVVQATLRITVDNGYTLFLDGEEIGRGSDWRTVTEYDVTELLAPGRHVLGVEGFNDRLEGGLIFGLHIELASQQVIDVTSDKSWLVGPGDGKKWAGTRLDTATVRSVIVIGPMHAHPWEIWPYGLATVPPLHPLLVHFWQRGWFELALFCMAAAALLFSLWLLTQLAAQAKAQNVLRVERVRIARDIHDDLGAQLTQLLLLGEVAQLEQPETSPARSQFTQICDRARELAHAMDEVVWAVNSRRDTVRDFTSYVCKYAQNFLGPTNIRCRLDVEPEMPATAFDLPVRRSLFLAVKEALNNAAKHSQADELFLRIYRREQKLSVAVEDNGRGFDPDLPGGERNGMTNMAQRMVEIGGTCGIVSQPGGGCLVVFTVPLPARRAGWFRRAAREDGPANEIETSGSGP
jgi:signal transduction histidine kinase